VLLTSRSTVSRAALFRLNRALPVGPPAVLSTMMAKVMNNRAKITASPIRYSQKPSARCSWMSDGSAS
jgi:hypothetical protein